jgi:hypothetical protein
MAISARIRILCIQQADEQKVISDFRASVDEFVSRLKSNVAFREAILSYPWISALDQHTEDSLDDPEYLSSMVVYLNALGQFDDSLRKRPWV